MKTINLDSYIYELRFPVNRRKVIKELLLYAGIIKVRDLVSTSKERLMGILEGKSEDIKIIENELKNYSLFIDMDKDVQDQWAQDSFLRRFT